MKLMTYSPKLFQRFGIGSLLCISAYAVVIAILTLIFHHFNIHFILHLILIFIAAVVSPFADIVLTVAGK